MKQGRKAIICFNKKSKGIPIFEIGNPNNLLWGAYQFHDADGVFNADKESWGSSAITLVGKSSGMSFGENEMFYIVPNNSSYIANNYTYEGASAHTRGLSGKLMLCVEAYRTGTANPNFRYATNISTGTTSYKVQCSQTVTSATPTIYRLEVDFTSDYRIEFNAITKCGNFIINNIWLEEIEE